MAKPRSITTNETLTTMLRVKGATRGVFYTEGEPESEASFFGQLSRIQEAERVLKLAEESGHFEDVSAVDVPSMRSADKANAVFKKRMEERAYELLAEQYPDIEVRFKMLSQSWSSGGKKWVCVGRGVETAPLLRTKGTVDISAKLEQLCKR